MKTITQVKEFNREMRAQGKYILMFTLGNGSMADEPRQRGYVVSEGQRHRYFPNIEMANLYANS